MNLPGTIRRIVVKEESHLLTYDDLFVYCVDCDERRVDYNSIYHVPWFGLSWPVFIIERMDDKDGIAFRCKVAATPEPLKQ